MTITQAFARSFARHESGGWRISKGKLEAQRGVDGDTIDWIRVSVVDAEYLPADGWVEWNGIEAPPRAPLWWLQCQSA